MNRNNFDVIKEDERSKVKYTNGEFVFEMPEKTAEMLTKDLKFDMDDLNIEAQPTIVDLVRHISKQASTEAFLNTQCAYVRNALEVAKEEFNSWYNKTCFMHRIKLIEEHKSKFSEKLLENYMHNNYQVKIYQHKARIIKLDTKYRDLCGVRDSFTNKGRYLQTLRSLVEVTNQPIIEE